MAGEDKARLHNETVKVRSRWQVVEEPEECSFLSCITVGGGGHSWPLWWLSQLLPWRSLRTCTQSTCAMSRDYALFSFDLIEQR